MKKKVIVVGAGVGGMTAAIQLQQQGYQVDLYDKNKKPGGKMNQIKEDGYTFDIGPTIVMMPEVYQDVFRQAGRNSDDYIPMTPIEPMLNLYFAKEEPLQFSSDLTKLTKTLEGISEADAQGYYKFLADIYQRYLIAKDNFLSRSYRKPWDFYNPKSLMQGLRLKTFSNAYASISKYVKDERLRKSLAFQTLYIGISPYQGPSLYNIIPMIELFYGVQFIKGGMYTLVNGMDRLFKELGGTTHYGSEVSEITFADQQATGIKVDGKQETADYVICNADFSYAMKNLIPNEKDRGKYTDKKIDKMEYSCSCFVMYLGLDKKYPDSAVHSIYFADDFKKNIADIFENHIFPADPSFYIYLPTVMDQSLAPEGHEGMYILVPVPDTENFNQWDAEDIAKYKAMILDKIKTKTDFKDIEDHIVFERENTPRDFETKYNAYRGATFGLKPTLMQSNYYRPHNKFKYAERLYFCGSSTHPGAGVPIVMQSANLAVKELLRDDQPNETVTR